MQNVLVIGGAGYIGSHTVKRILQQGYHVTVIDNLSTGSKEALPKQVDFYHVDIRNIDKLHEVFSVKKFDAVVHFAAKLSVPESLKRHFEYFDINVVGTRNILQLCQEFEINKFIFSSTAAVYGSVSGAPVTEDHVLLPQNPYGLTKLMAEKLIENQAKIQKGFCYRILRYFNVAGAEADASNGPRNYESGQLVMNLCKTAAAEKKVQIFGYDFNTKDGTAVRDYIHVLDLAEAHVQAYQVMNENKTSGVWNCGYGQGYTVLEVVKAFEKAAGVTLEINKVSRREGDPAEVVADNRRILAESRWRPQHNDIELICRSSFDWVKHAFSKR